MFSQKHKDFGVLEIKKGLVKVYESKIQYTNIITNKDIKDARWTGSYVTVWLENGEVRRYSGVASYEYVR